MPYVYYYKHKKSTLNICRTCDPRCNFEWPTCMAAMPAPGQIVVPATLVAWLGYVEIWFSTDALKGDEFELNPTTFHGPQHVSCLLWYPSGITWIRLFIASCLLEVFAADHLVYYTTYIYLFYWITCPHIIREYKNWSTVALGRVLLLISAVVQCHESAEAIRILQSQGTLFFFFFSLLSFLCSCHTMTAGLQNSKCPTKAALNGHDDWIKPCTKSNLGGGASPSRLCDISLVVSSFIYQSMCTK